MAAKNEGLADELVKVARFAQGWLAGAQPRVPAGWQLEAMPGMLSGPHGQYASEADASPPQRLVTDAGHVLVRVPRGRSGITPGIAQSFGDPADLLATSIAISRSRGRRAGARLAAQRYCCHRCTK